MRAFNTNLFSALISGGQAPGLEMRDGAASLMLVTSIVSTFILSGKAPAMARDNIGFNEANISSVNT